MARNSVALMSRESENNQNAIIKLAAGGLFGMRALARRLHESIVSSMLIGLRRAPCFATPPLYLRVIPLVPSSFRLAARAHHRVAAAGKPQ